jgi:hypothetical protein
MPATGEDKPLLDASMAAQAASAGAGWVNASASKIQRARLDGPLTFRMLGFVGGIAMILSNGIAILERFFSFNFSGCLIAIYGVAFGVIIVMMDAPGPCSQRLQSGVRYYAKFLELTWGRGMFFFFCGTLQASNMNMLDWGVGGFMIFVGLTAMGVSIATARKMRLLHFSVQSEDQMKQMWNSHDLNHDRFLDVKEFTAFVHDAKVDMTRNEIAAAYLALGAYSCKWC